MIDKKNNFEKDINVPHKEQVIIDNVSNFCLVCYYDNKNKELVRIEQYKDGSGDIQTDIESHKYGYNAKIIKPEELIKQLARKTAECEELKERTKCNCFDPKSNNNRCISYNRIVEDYEKDLKRLGNKTAECEKWKSYYNLYRLNSESLKKIQAVINSHPKYGIELTDTGVVEKDERICTLEVHEQIKLIFDETLQECEKYEQALDEFELLITDHISSCEKCPDNKNGYCIGIDECSSRCFKKILDIINKAKDGE